jgi:hypothetical protein
MKATISTLLAVCALILVLAGPAAPINAQEWNADNLPTGSNAWWKAMDREGRDGRPNN